MPCMKQATYDSGRSINDLAGRIITHLLEYGAVRGGILDGVWRPATVHLAHALYPGDEIETHSHGRNDGPAYTRYYRTMAALNLLHELELIALGRDARDIFLISLVDGECS